MEQDGELPGDELEDQDQDDQGRENPASAQVDFGRDDDPTAGASDIGGRAGEGDDR